MTTSSDAAHITIDGREVAAPRNTLLWEAAHQAGIDIPIFCYHSKLGPVGVCRMCLVEIEGQPKLTTACTTGIADGMTVHTRSPAVEKAQRGILEFLLINHPLDCPICDRAGECPLQDQTFQYGPGISRFVERKRHFLKPVHLGPTIDLDRERCILCWRCVRYTSEVVQDDQLILVDRGSETYIGTYEGMPYESNFTGNVIELCPVGALTSRKQRFTFRPWEIEQHPSVCPHCAMGCNIVIDVRDAQEVIRFRSRTNDAVDDGWLCDRGRFGYDFIGSPARLTTPLVRREEQLVPCSWQTAYRTVAENLQRIGAESGPDSIAGIVSPRLPLEDLFAFRRFMTEAVGTGAVDYWPRPEVIVCTGEEVTLDVLDRHLTTIAALDRSKLIVVIGTDPSERQPVMELRVKKAVNKLGATLVEIGTHDIALTEIAAVSLRCGGQEIAGLVRALTMPNASPLDAHSAWPEFGRARALLDREGPIVVLYEEDLSYLQMDARMDMLKALAGWVATVSERQEVGVIPMLRAANEMACRDLGLTPRAADGGRWGESLVERLMRGDFRAAFIAGADPGKGDPAFVEAVRKLDFCAVSELVLSETAGAADVVLPAASFAERVGTFINSTRRIQVFGEAVPTPGIARPDWQIMVDLSQRWDNPLSYASQEAILEDIAGSVPAYRERLPRSYAQIDSMGIGISPGEMAAAE